VKNKSGIYYIQNINNGKIYIGSAVCIIKRWRVHKHLLSKTKHYNGHLQSAWTEYGEDSFVFGVIETVIDKRLLLEREQYWIDYYKSFNKEVGYNLTPVAGSNLGRKHTEVTKEKLRKVGFPKGMIPWNKGKKMEGEYKEKHLKAMQSEERKRMLHNRKGFRHTEEARRKISKAGIGRVCSAETKKKMAEAHFGKKMPLTHRENCIKAWKVRKLKKQNKED
jgi:group I intron endonuclease